jgi:hypothetical protein
MQHLPSSSTELNNFIDYSSFDDSINLEEFISNKNDNQLTLTKLFALLRTWNKAVHNNFAKLILLVSTNQEKLIKINYNLFYCLDIGKRD